METKNTPPVFGDAIKTVAGGREKITVSGLWGSSKALFLWELHAALGRPVLAVSPTPKEAEALTRDYNFFAGRPDGAVYFPPWDVLPYDVLAPDPAVVAARLKVLSDISSGTAGVVITPVKAFMQTLPRPDALFGPGRSVKLAVGADADMETLISRFIGMGYTRAGVVYEPGEFSVRGGILDVFPPGRDNPVRAEFFGDTVESLRAFDPGTQRSIAELTDAAFLPASEGPPDMSDITEYFSGRPVLALDEPERALAQAAEFEARVFSAYEQTEDESHPRPEALYMPASGLASLSERLSAVHISSMPISEPDETGRFGYATRSIEGMRLRDSLPPGPWPEEVPKTPAAIFCRNLGAMLKGRAVNVVSHTEGQRERLSEIFAEHGLPALAGGYVVKPEAEGASGALRVVAGELSAGFSLDDPPLTFVTYSEIFGEPPKRAPAPRAKVERFLTSLSELSTGDSVVHVDHGIGRYEGLKRLTLMGVEADFLEVSYLGSDRLYVPVEELYKVQKYIGAESAAVRLDRLGGAAWEKAKARAKKAVADIAKELLELYAARSVAPGHAFGPDDHLYGEMESAFEYEETPDQARAITEVKADMEEPHPMDRLVCGDVGYGKTEVAVRAAFKAALDGKQTAVLVPTTLLANQHYETFRARLSAFPVRVEMLSRFTPKERKKDIVKGISGGAVDIVIGTHRLLQKDVSFKDLGLLVIDEEHRFGVAHKEKLKRLKKQVDVLTLTATPIPRTLNMSLSGIRDLSIIETPPPDRQPIKTIVTRFDNAAIKEAAQRELMRGGQVFFVHNRIESIYQIASLLTTLLPEARLGVAHGRMHEEALEDVMSRFVSGKIDLLVTTSIIESGLDIPAANTIIINRADRFGLADLYQLRGRVGRSGVRAYAYLLVPGEGMLSETAQKRLRVLSELTELGAGFKLALHDLEIRGAGNVLGAQQSGHITAVGFELYTRLLEEAVRELKGEAVEEEIDPALDLKVSAYIPDSYVPDTAHRLGIYKRLASARSQEELADLEKEIHDRYGAVPAPAKRLIEVMELKIWAKSLKAAGIQLTPAEVKLTFTDKVDIPPDRLLGFLRARKGAARYVPKYTIFIKKPAGEWDGLFAGIKNCLKELAGV